MTPRRRRVYTRGPASLLDAVPGAGQGPVSRSMTDSVTAPVGSDVPVSGRRRRSFHAGLVGAYARQHRRRLRRYRHQPALCVARGHCRRLGPEPRGELTRDGVLGVVSLILWALIIVVTLKYVLILLRADNNGEGGTLTLMALASRAVGRVGKAAGDRRAARHRQRRAVLRRCRHHAGAVGALGDRRPRRRNAGIPRLRGAADRGHPGRAVCVSVARHRERRGAVRSDH